MSLPASQQRVLDGIAEALLASEPRLASMFAIFTRLCRSEEPPWREQLTAGPGLRAAAVWTRLRLPARQAARGRRTWRRLLVLSQVAIAIVLLSVLIGLNSTGLKGCGTPAPKRAAEVSSVRSDGCHVQAGLISGLLRK
jgi:hypothetical protein